MSEPNRQYHQALSANRKLLDENARLNLQFANSEQENTRLNNYIERLEVRNAELVPENARLKAEVERLRKAGDELLHEWSSGDETNGRNFMKGLVIWNAAKEGKQS